MDTNTVLALACVVASVVFSVMHKDYQSPTVWALWAIFVVLVTGAHYAL